MSNPNIKTEVKYSLFQHRQLSEFPVPSCLSIKSDNSKGLPLTFSEDPGSATHTNISQKGAAVTSSHQLKNAFWMVLASCCREKMMVTLLH